MKTVTLLTFIVLSLPSLGQNFVGWHKNDISREVKDLYNIDTQLINREDGDVVIGFIKDDFKYEYYIGDDDSCYVYLTYAPYKYLTQLIKSLNQECEKVNDEEWIRYGKDCKYKYKLFRDETEWYLACSTQPYK